jgi:hypothetical protein
VCNKADASYTTRLQFSKKKSGSDPTTDKAVQNHSGETFTNYADQQDLCVIGTWQGMEEWLKWKENPERKNIEAMLEIFQLGPTVYEEDFLGTPYQKSKNPASISSGGIF